MSNYLESNLKLANYTVVPLIEDIRISLNLILFSCFVMKYEILIKNVMSVDLI